MAHVAAKTTAVSVKAYKDPTETTGLSEPIPDLQVTPPPVSATVGTKTFSTGIPFVQFSQYEVVGCRKVSCFSHTYNLSTPYAFRYTGSDPSKATNVDAATVQISTYHRRACACTAITSD